MIYFDTKHGLKRLGIPPTHTLDVIDPLLFQRADIPETPFETLRSTEGRDLGTLPKGCRRLSLNA